MLHVGDEAMFEAMVAELRSRGATTITGISSNPSDSAARYGIDAVAGLGFRGLDRAAMTARMRAIVEGTVPADDPSASAAAAIAAADLVVIAGGGNMTSTWPSHIVERATIAALADAAGVPVVISGQTLGPALTAEDAGVLSDLLGTAALVSTREADSRALAHVLGVRATAGPDDASFLADLVPGDIDVPTSPYCLVTLSTHTGTVERGEFATAVAAVLDHVVATTHLRIVFSGHFVPLDGPPRGDEVVHELVRAAMTSESELARVTTTAESAALARGADLVVSSRYHPAVFAVSAGVPTIAIPVDDYTEIKLRGALGNFEQDTLLPASELIAGNGPTVVQRAWSERAATRQRGIARARAQRELATAWWNDVAAVGATHK